MPRKPVPSFTRVVQLPFGKLELTVTGNPLAMTAKDRALFNQILDQVEVTDRLVKATAGAGEAADGATS